MFEHLKFSILIAITLTIALFLISFYELLVNPIHRNHDKHTCLLLWSCNPHLRNPKNLVV